MTRMSTKTCTALALALAAAALAPTAGIAASNSNEPAASEQVQPHSRQAPAGYVPQAAGQVQPHSRQAPADYVPQAAGHAAPVAKGSGSDTDGVLIGLGFVAALGLIAGTVVLLRRRRDASQATAATVR
jgi:hypothetical protein